MEIGFVTASGGIYYCIEGHEWWVCDVGELAAKEDATDSVSLLISEAALDADIARVEKEFKPKRAWV